MLFAKKPTWVKLLITLGAAGVILLLTPLSTKLHGIAAYAGLAPAVAAVSAAFLPPLWALTGAALPLILGMIGLPVFPGGNAGLTFLASSAGGYALAPLWFAGIGGLFLWLKREEEPKPGAYALGLVAAILASNLTGTLWLVGVGGYDWSEVLRRGTLWMALGDLFRSVIAFSIFFFYHREIGRRAVWERRLRTHRRWMDERYELLDALDRAKVRLVESDEVKGEEVERARRELKASERDDLPPYVKL